MTSEPLRLNGIKATPTPDHSRRRAFSDSNALTLPINGKSGETICRRKANIYRSKLTYSSRMEQGVTLRLQEMPYY